MARRWLRSGAADRRTWRGRQADGVLREEMGPWRAGARTGPLPACKHARIGVGEELEAGHHRASVLA